jgi:PAS domain S-box-containing protein
MIRDGLVSETLLNNILRAAAIYKLQDGKVSIVQINDSFSALTGISANEECMNCFESYLEEEELKKLHVLFRKADSHALGGSEGTILFRRPDGEQAALHMRVFLLYFYQDHRIYLSTTMG